MANFGIGIGAFADGFMRGVALGKTLKGIRKENEAEKLQAQLMDDARKARDQEVEAETARLLGSGGAKIQQATAPAGNSNVGTGPEPSPAQAYPVDVGPDAPPQPVQSQEAAPRPQAAAPAPSIGIGPAPGSAQAQQSAVPPTVIASAGGIGAPHGGGLTPEQARAIAEKKSPSILDIFRKQGVPRIAEHFIQNGQIDKAEAWLKWAESSESRKAQETWAKAWRATQVGNIEAAADHFFDLYKSMDDSVTLSGKEVVKDKAGNITGFNVKMRDKATGENRAVFVDRDQLLNMGLSALSPPQLFEAIWNREEANRKARMDAQAEVGKIQLQTQKELAVEDARQRGRIELQDRKVQQGIELLRQAGYSDAFINGVMPQLLGVDQSGPYRKGPSPEELMMMAHRDRMQNDMRYARLSPQEQDAIIRTDMQRLLAGAEELRREMQARSGQQGQPPAQGGATPAPGGAAPANPAARGLPVLDTKTGKIIFR